MILYLLLLEGGAYYTGVTPDLQKRLAAHTGKAPGGARATRMKKPLALAAAWETDRARNLEVRVKRLSHRQKALLAEDPTRLTGVFFPEEQAAPLDPAPYAALFSRPPETPGCKG